MEIIRTFRRPERFSAAQWRFTLNAWIAISLIGAVVSGVVAITVAILIWSVVAKATNEYGWTTAVLAAASPLLGFAMSAVWWWMFLSSLRTSRRFPPTG